MNCANATVHKPHAVTRMTHVLTRTYDSTTPPLTSTAPSAPPASEPQPSHITGPAADRVCSCRQHCRSQLKCTLSFPTKVYTVALQMIESNDCSCSTTSHTRKGGERTGRPGDPIIHHHHSSLTNCVAPTTRSDSRLIRINDGRSQLPKAGNTQWQPPALDVTPHHRSPAEAGGW